jgi:hypothetical protein
MKEKIQELHPLPCPDTIGEIDTVVLHQACMFAGGRTESTLNTVKVPGIKMWWSENLNGLLFTIKNMQKGFIPAPAVKILYFK